MNIKFGDKICINLNNSKKTDFRNIPWCGNLDEIEVHRPGGLLMAALIRHANEHQIQLNELARELGVTYGYINQLRNGIRRIDQISDEFSSAAACFLGVPRLAVLLLSGQINPSDCFESEKLMASEICRAMSYICADPEWGHFITPELRSADEVSQFGLVKIFEAATGKVLLNKALDLNNLAKKVLEFREIIAVRKEAVVVHFAKKANKKIALKSLRMH